MLLNIFMIITMNRILYHISIVLLIHLCIILCCAIYSFVPSTFNFLYFLNSIVEIPILAFKFYLAFFNSKQPLQGIMWILTFWVIIKNVCFFIKQDRFTISHFYFCNTILIGLPGLFFLFIISNYIS